MKDVQSRIDGGFDMEQYENELDAIVADVIPDKEA